MRNHRIIVLTLIAAIGLAGCTPSSEPASGDAAVEGALTEVSDEISAVPGVESVVTGLPVDVYDASLTVKADRLTHDDAQEIAGIVTRAYAKDDLKKQPSLRLSVVSGDVSFDIDFVGLESTWASAEISYIYALQKVYRAPLSISLGVIREDPDVNYARTVRAETAGVGTDWSEMRGVADPGVAESSLWEFPGVTASQSLPDERLDGVLTSLPLDGTFGVDWYGEAQVVALAFRPPTPVTTRDLTQMEGWSNAVDLLDRTLESGVSVRDFAVDEGSADNYVHFADCGERVGNDRSELLVAELKREGITAVPGDCFSE